MWVEPGGILEMKMGTFLSWIGWRKWYGKAKAKDNFYVFRTQATSDNQFLDKETDWSGGDRRGRKGQVLRAESAVPSECVNCSRDFQVDFDLVCTQTSPPRPAPDLCLK